MTTRLPVWHPFTQHAITGEAIEIARGEGAWLYTKDGRKIFDAISSWWVNIHGHGHPVIARAVAAQAERLEQVIFAGFTHEPAERLARRLIALAPRGLDHVFYSDSGSTAVEVAIKMAVGTWHNRGTPRTHILALEHGYHGDMFGAMAVGQRGAFNAAYDPMLFGVDHLPFPEKGAEEKTLDALRRALEAKPDTYAALILEPLVLGAGGMKVYRPEVLAEIAALLKRHGVFLIADEVMTGFGRTGTLFACAQAGVSPDLMCVSKGLTGGFLPMGATLASAEIFDAFYSEDRAKTFFHSSSFTGNALAAAAANASLDLFDVENTMAKVAALAEAQGAALARFEGKPYVAEIRRSGTIAAVELKAERGGYFADVGLRIARAALEADILLRPLGNVVYVLPPYCTTQEALSLIYERLEHILDRQLSSWSA
jgi:adenosylmethionine-8-amino-7-oxononanoate aminotransferase